MVADNSTTIYSLTGHVQSMNRCRYNGKLRLKNKDYEDSICTVSRVILKAGRLKSLNRRPKMAAKKAYTFKTDLQRLNL